MNDPRIMEEIMNQERSRSWLMTPPPTQTAPLPTQEAKPDTVPAHEPAPSRLTKEQLSEVRRKAALLRHARRRALIQDGATKPDADASVHSQLQARYWSRLSPEERSAEMRRRMAARKSKLQEGAQPAAQQSAAQADTSANGRASHSLVEQLQAIQARGEQLAQAAAALLSLIIH